MTVAQLLRQARTDKGLSLDALARKAGLSFATVIRAEGGKTSPRAETLFQLATALDLSMQDVQDAMAATVGEPDPQAAERARLARVRQLRSELASLEPQPTTCARF